MSAPRRPVPIMLRLRALREAQGMSQHELATRAGYSLGCLNRWETGRNDPSIRAVHNCAEALGVKIKINVPRVHARETAKQGGQIDARI